jgi:hypothetical protein
VGQRIKKAGLVAGALVFVGGCQSVGPLAIDAGRDRYNTTLQSTAKAQTLANIIRVYNHDSTSFMDVAEVDATTTLTGTAGRVWGIGTPAAMGSVTGGVTYTETPLVRYVPLTGQGLVSQLVRPLDADAIDSLVTSNWPAVAVLDLVAFHLAPDRGDDFLALNVMSSLTKGGYVTLAAGKSELTAEPPSRQKSGTGNNNNNNSGMNQKPANDTLMVFQRDINPAASDRRKAASDQGKAEQLWKVLKSIYTGTQKDPDKYRYIELRTVPVLPKKSDDGRAAAKRRDDRITNFAPLLRTYSGMGILKRATERPGPKIGFVLRDEYDKITDHDWNKKDAEDRGFYILLPREEPDDDNPLYKRPQSPDNNIMSKCDVDIAVESKYVDACINGWIEQSKEKDFMIYGRQTGWSVADHDFILGNRRLASLRRYLLIIVDDAAPSDAYVAYPYQGKWYYIDGKDSVSQKNFHLMSLLLTMMSVPTTLAPITTSIPTGGGAQ